MCGPGIHDCCSSFDCVPLPEPGGPNKINAGAGGAVFPEFKI
jgi:hypothetical protein